MKQRPSFWAQRIFWGQMYLVEILSSPTYSLISQEPKRQLNVGPHDSSWQKHCTHMWLLTASLSLSRNEVFVKGKKPLFFSCVFLPGIPAIHIQVHVCAEIGGPIFLSKPWRGQMQQCIKTVPMQENGRALPHYPCGHLTGRSFLCVFLVFVVFFYDRRCCLVLAI